jgi:hypothetical protein
MKQVKFKDIKHTDWSKHSSLTAEQRNQLIREKLERARLWHAVLNTRKNGHHAIC